MAEITAASREQSLGIDQVNEAIAQMDQVTQQNAALVEEAAAAAAGMQDQAGQLAQLVRRFRLAEVPGLAAPAAQRPAALPGRSVAPATPAARRGAAPAPAPAPKAGARAAAMDEWERF
jgi:methyl-accepting chemotaxis protein